MSDFERFSSAVKLGRDIGPASPYARLYYLDDSGFAGADADVEYRETDSGGRIVVTISEWSKSANGPVVRAKPTAYQFDEAGKLLGDELDMADLLASASGMSVLSENGEE